MRTRTKVLPTNSRQNCWRQLALASLASALLSPILGLLSEKGQAATFANTTTIPIPASGPATPYPSPISVAGLTGQVTRVLVVLSNVSHTFPDDLDVLLVGPGGQSVILMSDAGGGSDISGVTLTFVDNSRASLSDTNQIDSGASRPVNYAGSDTFVSPAPPGPYGAALSVFDGTNPNGTWNLFVVDDAASDSGRIANGWRLTVFTDVPPTITAQPQSQMVLAGSNAAFAVTGIGLPALTYRWRFNWVDLPGATNATLTIPATQATNAGIYFVVVSNAFGSVTSSIASLTVLVPPRILVQPQNRVVMTGEDVTFGLGVSGTAPFSFRWRRGGATISAATNSTYTVSNAQPGAAANYSVIVANAANAIGVRSSNASLTVMVPPPGVSVRINEVQPDNHAGIMDGAGQREPWVELYNAGATSQRLDGFYLANNFSNLTQWPFPAGMVIGPGQFRLVWVDAQPEQTAGGELHAGFRLSSSAGAVVLSRVVNGSTQMVHLVNYSGIGFNRSFGSYPDGHASARRVFYAVTPGAMNSPATPPVIISPPQSLTVTAGSNAVFSVAAMGTQPLGYQWRFNGTNIPGAAGTNFTVATVQTNRLGRYSVVVSNVAGIFTTRPALLKLVDTQPPIITCPTDITTTAKSTLGTPVRWTVLARDHLDTNVMVECRPSSGTLFPLGTTPVACTAKDESGNRSQCRFSVTVANPPPLLISPPANGTVVLRWTGNRLLQETDSLSPPIRWRNGVTPVIVINGENTVAVPVTRRTKFYRLTYTDAKTLFTDMVHRQRSYLAYEFARGTLDSSAYLGLLRDRTAKLRLAQRTPNYMAAFAEGDEDHDLVPDSLDQCHGTPLATVTDDRGCPDPGRARPPAPDDRLLRELVSHFRMAVDPDCAGTPPPVAALTLKLGYNNVDRSTFKLAIVPVQSAPSGCPIFYEFNVAMDVVNQGDHDHKVANFVFKETDNIEPNGTRAVFVVTQSDTGPRKVLFDNYHRSNDAFWRVRAVNGTGVAGPWSLVRHVFATPSFGEP